MTFRTRSVQARNHVAVPNSWGVSRNPMNYPREIDAWLSACGPKEHGSRVAAAQLCLLCNQTNDRVLMLPPGKLTQLPPLPGHIEQLHVPNNKIKSLPSLHHWPADLNEIYLPKNKLRKIEGQNLPNSLAVLDISDNRVQSLRDPFPFSLRVLIGSGNPLEDLPVEWPTQLEELRLKNCKLYFFPDGLPDSIQSIDVSSNPIESLSKSDMPVNLRELSLASTGIKHIPDNVFPAALRTLDLSNNNFDYFAKEIREPRVFPGKVTNIDFRGCNLVRPPRFLSKLTDAATIDLRDNPFSEKGRNQAHEMEAMSTSGLHLKITESTRPLANEVQSWLREQQPQESHAEQVEAWRRIQNQPGRRRHMQAFSGFLGRLRQTELYQSADGADSLRHRVCHLVVALPNNEPLRERCMHLAQEVVGVDTAHLPQALENMELEHVRWKDENGLETRIVHLSNRAQYREACQNPQPNTTYHYNDPEMGSHQLTFTTDSLGRAVNSAGQLRISSKNQRFHDDSRIGHPYNKDAKRGDIGFHAGANSLGFPGGTLNVFPGNSDLNSSNGAYGQCENEVLRPMVAKGATVHAQFTRQFKSDNPTTRPDTIQIIYKADGEPRMTRTFLNLSDEDTPDSSDASN